MTSRGILKTTPKLSELGKSSPQVNAWILDLEAVGALSHTRKVTSSVAAKKVPANIFWSTNADRPHGIVPVPRASMVLNDGRD